MKILLACGGSGGHIFPGMALAKALEKKEPNAEIVFVGTGRGLEQKLLSQTPWRLEMITAVSFADKKGLSKLKALLGLIGSLGSSFKLLRKERPDLLIGVGGYISAPILMMASALRIPTVTIEPNATPGLANRLLKYFVRRVIVAFPNLQNYFGKKGRCLGVPVREEILEEARRASARQASARQEAKTNVRVVLILGGSQGAHSLNTLILEALPWLKNLKEPLHFIHQVGGKEDIPFYQSTYQCHGLSAEVTPFIAKMGEVYGRADFIIARAGANTVAEISALKIPTLFIPYPFAKGHQEANARELEKGGAVKVLLEKEATGQKLAEILQEVLSSSEKREAMQKSFPTPGAKEINARIAEECLSLVQ